jgi:replicative DNA helicase
VSDPKVAPQNLDAEESVLGAMMLSSDAITAVCDIITPEDFYRGSHGLIFKAALDIDARGEKVDALVLAAELDRTGKLAAAGGKVRIHELAALTPHVAGAARWAKLVEEAALRRGLIGAGQKIEKLGWEGIGTIDELVGEAEKALTGSRQANGSFVNLQDTANEVLSQIETAIETGVELSGLKTGIGGLDRLTTGFYPEQFIVVAARPSVGKSVFLANIAQNIAYKTGPVGFISLEMTKAEITQRTIARLSKVPLTSIRIGKMNNEELVKVQQAVAMLREWPLFVRDEAVSTMAEIRAAARRLHRQEKIICLFVDYLQLTSGAANTQANRQEQVAEISRGLKTLAKELKIPIVAASQLSRKAEDRDRPILSDLRESGAIEQDADTVIFLHREDLYNASAKNAGDAEAIIAKARMGETGTVKLLFFGKRQQFSEPAKL